MKQIIRVFFVNLIAMNALIRSVSSMVWCSELAIIRRRLVIAIYVVVIHTDCT